LAANPVVESDSFVKNSPLLVAIQNNYWNWVEALLQRGAKANKVFEQGTVLHYPMSADWIRRLVAEGAPLQVMYRGESPLSQAVKNNNTESALTLLSLNAPVRSPELDALHLLHRATHWGNIEVVKALLNGGAELDALDNRLRTALGVAMLRVPSNEAQFAPLVLELIARGSKLDHSSADTGPLLHRAASFSSTQILSAMLDKGARIETLDGSGNSAYVNASLANAKFLGTRGLRFDIRNSKQQSVIAVLLRMGRKSKLPILSWLYEQRAHVGDLSLQELRPYHYVLRNEPYSADDEKIEDYLKFLKDVGFDPNVLDRGSDPLALQYPWALQRDPALTSLFIELGAQIHATMPPSGRWNKPYSFADVLQLEVRDMEQEIAAVKNRGDNDLAQKLERLYRGPIALRRELLNLIANAP
jgi:hypothetical protein